MTRNWFTCVVKYTRHGADGVEEKTTDQLLLDIADYVVGYEIKSRDAVKTARYAVLDAMACSMLSLNFPECAKLLGPVVPGATVTHGAHVPGTDHDVDPVTAAHNFSTCVRWLDYNDTWLASEWIHPSDVVGAIVPLAEYLTRVRLARALPPLTMKDVIVAVIKAYEVCGVLALENSLNQIGVDHSLMTRVAVASTCTRMLGGGRREVCDASSQAFADGAGLRCFRHYPNNGTRKGWAAGDACAEHECVEGLQFLMTSFVTDITVILLIEAMKFGELRIVFSE